MTDIPGATETGEAAAAERGGATPAVIPEEQLDRLDDIDAIMSELGPAPTEVQIYQVERGNRHHYLETWEPSEFSLDAVKARWGGGKFQIRVKGEKGSRNYLVQRTFSIAGPSLLQPAGLPAALVTGPQPQANGDVTGLRREVQELKELIRGQASEKSRFEEMIALTKLLGERERPYTDPVESLLKGMELQEKMGGAGGSDGYSEVLSRLGVPLLDFLQSQAAKEKEAGAAAPGQLPPGEPPDIHAPAWLPPLAPWIPQLLELAAGGRPPHIYAALVVDSLEASADPVPLAVLRDSIAQGDAFLAEFFERVPDAMERDAWFRELFGEIEALLFADDDDSAD